MNHFANRNVLREIMLLVLLLSSVKLCIAQRDNENRDYSQSNNNSFFKTLDSTISIQLYKIINKELSDSLLSAYVQLENNWNYNDEYSYFFLLSFLTKDNPDSIYISIDVLGIRSLNSFIINSRPVKYMKMIGCIREKGHLILVDAGNFVSREEINHYIEPYADSVKFDISVCGNNNPFFAWPFHRLKFQGELKNKGNFVSPSNWEKYETIIKK